ncbi:MAG: NAD(P)H-dependent oxidoreductase [Devosia sp.]
MYSLPKIGIIIGSTRPNRFADTPTKWLFEIASKRNDALFEIVDLRDYPMPFFEEARSPGYAQPSNEIARRWGAKMAELDGYIFVAAEYNHSITGVLKNAIDYLFPEVQRKPAAFLAYGNAGGTRAVQHLKHVLAELQVASLRFAVHIGMVEMIGMLREGKTMADYPYLDDTAVKMLDDLVWWANTLRAGRQQQAVAAAA